MLINHLQFDHKFFEHVFRLVSHYLIPIIVFSSWLVITTFLHHQDENVPWYADDR
jgi:hypothetical protein